MTNKTTYKTPKELEQRAPRFTKSELVDLLDELMYLPKSEIKRFLDLIFQLILVKAKQGYCVKIHNFGKFHCYLKKNKKARDLHLGTEITLPERHILRFTPTVYTQRFLNPDKLKARKKYDPKYAGNNIEKLNEVLRQTFGDAYDDIINEGTC